VSVAEPGWPAVATVGSTPVDLRTAARLLVGARTVMLLAHVNPDADALGSALALGLALERRGTRVVVSFASPATVPESLRHLPGQHLIRPAALVPDDLDLLVTMDVASVERLGAFAGVVRTVPTLVVDHHTSNTRFGTHHLVDPSAEATVVLVHLLLEELGEPLAADAAASLYAGLATDTAFFRNVTAHTHRLAAELLDSGADAVEVLRPIGDSHPFEWLPMLSTVLGRAELDRAAVGGRGLVHTHVTRGDSIGLRQEELDSIIDILRTAREADVAVVGKENAPDRWQISLRGRPGVDVAAAATSLGGGGHVRAAGFSWSGRYPDAIEALRAVLASSGDGVAGGLASSGDGVDGARARSAD
jgi:bifunctional oligoribonuclease and PAP phosphatase NrnA